MRACAHCGAAFEPALQKDQERTAKYYSDACRTVVRRAHGFHYGGIDLRNPELLLPPEMDVPMGPLEFEWEVSCLLHGVLTTYRWTEAYARLEQMAGRRRCAHCHQPLTISRALMTVSDCVA